MTNVAVVALLVVAGCSSRGKTGEGECVPACGIAECGEDGCGGSCGECDDGLGCTNDSCSGGKCAYALQGMFCLVAGACVPSGTVNPANECEGCKPAASQQGWSPLDDGTECGAQKVCVKGACCDAKANCAGKECGSDGCGGSCGECDEFSKCTKGKCVKEECTPKCDGKECGEDGCGGSCGECTKAGFVCEEGACVCKPDCTDMECGPDGCGGSCGTCSGVNVACKDGVCGCAGAECGDGCCGMNQVCTDLGECCTLKCDGKECGEDECGGVCGTCVGSNVICHEGKCACPGFFCGQVCCMAGEVCLGDSTCCQPACDGKDCGPDGCNGVCGTCDPGQICVNGKCPAAGKDCDDGNDAAWDGCNDGVIAELVVNSTLTGMQDRPQVAGLTDGRFVVAWQSDKQDTDEWGIFLRRIKAGGGGLEGVEFQANMEVADDQENPAVAALSDGGFVAVWEGFGQDGNGDGVFGQRFQANGVKSGVEFPVNTHTVSNQELPDVAALAGGGFVVVWSGVGPEDWGGVYGQVFSSDGVKSGVQLPINATTQWDQRAPAVAGLADGSFVAAWESQLQDGDGQGIYARRFGSDGAPLSSESVVNDFWQLDQAYPAVGSLVGGGYVIAWHSDGQDGSNNGVLARVFDGSSLAVTPEFVVHDYTLGEQRYPALAGLSSGGFAIVWESKGQDGSDAGVYCRVFSADGLPTGTEFPVNTFTASNQQSPSISSTPAGQFLVTWRSWQQAGDDYDIFALRFDDSGDKLYQ